MKRGRKTIADLVVLVPGGRAMPPPPPATLTPAQQQIWADVCGNLPGDWVPPHAHALLMDYCRRLDTATRLAAEVEAFESSWLEVPGGVERYNALLSMRDRESRGAFAAARQLRLTPSSVVRKEVAGAALANHRPGAVPWDRGKTR